MNPRLYLAGPDVFREDALAWAEHLKEVCRKHGVTGVFPLDATLEQSPMQTKWDFASQIRRSNMALLRDCDGVLANITPFRGPNADDGTAFEMGVAAGLDKPVFPYSYTPLVRLVDKVALSFTLTLKNGHFWDEQGMQVEDFGMTANLMLFDERWGFFKGFEAAVEFAAWHFRRETT